MYFKLHVIQDLNKRLQGDSKSLFLGKAQLSKENRTDRGSMEGTDFPEKVNMRFSLMRNKKRNIHMDSWKSSSVICMKKQREERDRKSTRLNSSHVAISYAV